MFVTIEPKEAKKMFYEKHFFDQKAPNSFQCFITVFNQLSVFRCLTVYVVFKQAIQAIEGSFEKILVKKACFCQKDFF